MQNCSTLHWLRLVTSHISRVIPKGSCSQIYRYSVGIFAFFIKWHNVILVNRVGQQGESDKKYNVCCTVEKNILLCKPPTSAALVLVVSEIKLYLLFSVYGLDKCVVSLVYQQFFTHSQFITLIFPAQMDHGGTQIGIVVHNVHASHFSMTIWQIYIIRHVF